MLDQKKLAKAASKFRAIAHPTRLAIISLLEQNKEMNVTEIYNFLHIEQAVASHHLNILKRKGILHSKRKGKNTFYLLKQNILSQIQECLERCG